MAEALSDLNIFLINCRSCGRELLANRMLPHVNRLRKMGYHQPVAYRVRSDGQYCRCCVLAEQQEELDWETEEP